MVRVRLLPIAMSVCVLVAVGPLSQAQSDASAPPAQSQPTTPTPATQLKVRMVPEKVPPMPFPPGSESKSRVSTIEFRSAEQMSEKDKLIEADAESSIQERAGWSAMQFNEGQWSYKQLVCPAFPNHLFLQFTRNNGAGDVSVFSVSIPRNGASDEHARVRIIPILRRSYSLFSPAPINALTISAFNHIRDEEHAQKPPDWLMTALCYAALAGAHPEAVLIPDPPELEKFPAAMPAIMEIPENGGAIIRFADAAAKPRPMTWTMVFNGKGRLIKAGHSPAPLLTAQAIKPETNQAKFRPIPQTVVEVNPSNAK